MKYRFVIGLVSLASLVVAGCGGGGGSAPSPATLPSTVSSPLPASVTRVMDISFGGVSALSSTRATQGLTGTPVSVTHDGKTAATGTLDANGHAALTFTSDVPRGATVIVTAGSVKATVVLADADDGTAVQVQVKPDGSLTVSAQPEHPGASPAPSPSPGANVATIDEDHDGNPIVISTTMGALPGNLPLTVTANCGIFTIAPASAALPHVLIEMKTHDGDAETRFRFEGALTGPVSFPVPTQTLRVRIRIFAAGGGTLLDISGPITSTTGGVGAPCPAATASASPSASASASASPAASASPSANPSTAPSASPSASASPI